MKKVISMEVPTYHDSTGRRQCALSRGQICPFYHFTKVGRCILEHCHFSPLDANGIPAAIPRTLKGLHPPEWCPLSGKEEKAAQAPETAFKAPSLDDVLEAAKEMNWKCDAQHFWDYYEQREWKVKQGTKLVKMKNWRRAMRTWERNEKNKKSYYKPKYEKGGFAPEKHGLLVP